LALGADACSIGRPYLYGLAAGGQAGVQRALDLLRDEVLRGMALLGCRKIDEITPEKVRGSRFSPPERAEPGLQRVIAASRN
jgi:L-lactate dehydrogenase (cytochrome)